MGVPTRWQKAEGQIHRRLLVNVQGLDKSGKSNLALTAPDPIAYLNLDKGTEWVVEKFLTGENPWGMEKEVWLNSYERMRPIPKNAKATAKAAEPILDGLKEDWEQVLQSEARTLVVDTGTELYEVARLAMLGKLEQVLPHHYGPVHRLMKDLIQSVYDEAPHLNLVILHRLKPLYINDKRTKDLELAGYSGIPSEVQVNLLAQRDPDGDFTMEVIRNRVNPALDGMVWFGDDCNFPNIAATLTGTDEAEWL